MFGMRREEPQEQAAPRRSVLEQSMFGMGMKSNQAEAEDNNDGNGLNNTDAKEDDRIVEVSNINDAVDTPRSGGGWAEDDAAETNGAGSDTANALKLLERFALSEAMDLASSCFQRIGYELVGTELKAGSPPYVTCQLARLGDDNSCACDTLLAEESDPRRRAVLRCLQSVENVCPIAAESGFVVIGCDLVLKQLPTVTIHFNVSDSLRSKNQPSESAVGSNEAALGTKSRKSVMGLLGRVSVRK